MSGELCADLIAHNKDFDREAERSLSTRVKKYKSAPPYGGAVVRGERQRAPPEAAPVVLYNCNSLFVTTACGGVRDLVLFQAPNGRKTLHN